MKFAIAVLSVVAMSACSSPPRYAYVKEGSSKHSTETALSKCEYQIKLQKMPVGEQNALRKLCMEGEGYRLRQVN